VKDMVEGVIGGGVMGRVGESGHRNQGRGDSRDAPGNVGDIGPGVAGTESLARKEAEAEWTNCFRAETGLG
jgi:hypothetical protein